MNFAWGLAANVSEYFVQRTAISNVSTFLLALPFL